MMLVQLTDLHVRPRGIAANRVVETNMLTERAFRAVAALRPVPDAVVISGDLTECGLIEEYTLLAELLKRTLALPVYVIPGNHDRRERLAAGLPEYCRVTDGFIQYAVEDLPVRLVLLDSVVPGSGHGELCAARLDFLDRTLAEQPDKPTMVVLHHPPFICGIGHMDDINLRTSREFGAVLARHKQVQRIISGHHHRPIFTSFGHAIASISPSVAQQVELELGPVAGGGFVLEPPGYHIHLWDSSNGFVTHTALVEKFPGPFPFLTDPDYPGTMHG
jgi:3',5'-cyclic AMP phosphodiesterase CpdA